SAIVKVMRRDFDDLSESELMCVRGLAQDVTVLGSTRDDASLSLAERAAKRLATGSNKVNFKDCRFLLPTSNICEGFFSHSKHAMTDKRGNLCPMRFEAQMFLSMNDKLWGEKDVWKA
ncbi:unnamed protein product, partial [Aphanomyces euteiches]